MTVEKAAGQALGAATLREVQDPLIAIGRLTKPHSLRGEMVFLPYVYDLAILPDLLKRQLLLRDKTDALQRCLIVGWREFQKRVLIQLAGCTTMTAADALREHELLMPRSWFPALPEGEYYWFEIEGLQVYSSHGVSLGHITEIIHTGSNDVYVIKDGRHEILIPALKTVVRSIDITCGEMHLYPLAELFDS